MLIKMFSDDMTAEIKRAALSQRNEYENKQMLRKTKEMERLDRAHKACLEFQVWDDAGVNTAIHQINSNIARYTDEMNKCKYQLKDSPDNDFLKQYIESITDDIKHFQAQIKVLDEDVIPYLKQSSTIQEQAKAEISQIREKEKEKVKHYHEYWDKLKEKEPVSQDYECKPSSTDKRKLRIAEGVLRDIEKINQEINRMNTSRENFGEYMPDYGAWNISKGKERQFHNVCAMIDREKDKRNKKYDFLEKQGINLQSRTTKALKGYIAIQKGEVEIIPDNELHASSKESKNVYDTPSVTISPAKSVISRDYDANKPQEHIITLDSLKLENEPSTRSQPLNQRRFAKYLDNDEIGLKSTKQKNVVLHKVAKKKTKSNRSNEDR